MSDRIQLKRPSHTSDTQSSQSIFTPVTPSFIPTNQPTQVPPLGHDFSRISIQPKLTVSQPHDPYEQEADRVADEVMRMADPSGAANEVMRSPQDNIHRQCEACEDEEEIQAKLVDSVVQRKVMVMRSADGGLADSSIESRLSSSKGGGSPLPDEVRSFMEPRLGHDFSQVRVHTDSAAVQMNRDLNAQAFAYGSDIYFGAGKSPANDHLTAHELTHVVQQTDQIQRWADPDDQVCVTDESEVSSTTDSSLSTENPLYSPTRPAQTVDEHPFRRILSLQEGELLKVQASSSRDELQVTIATSSEVIATTKGNPVSFDHIAGKSGEFVVDVVPAQSGAVNIFDPSSVQVMISREPPGSAVSTGKDGAASLNSRQHLLLNLFGVNPRSLHPDTGLKLAEAIDKLEVLARQVATNSESAPTSIGNYALKIDQASGDQVEDVAYTLTDGTSVLWLHTQFDQASGTLVCYLSFQAEDGTLVQGALSHTVKISDGMPLIPTSNPVGDYLASDPGAYGELDSFANLTGDPEAAPSEEGLGSFFEGAIAGDFSENDSWSAVGGQVGIGFVPIAGQIADIRDIGAAGADVWNGKPGGWANLGISVVAIIPGLDFLKGGSKAGRKALKEGAEEATEDVARKGMKRAAKILSKEAAARAAKELKELSVIRRELLTRWQTLIVDEGLSVNARQLLRDARNALQDHLQPSDLAGALRDKLGVPVRASGSGAAWDHLGEVTDALQSLRNAREAMINRLEHLKISATDPALISRLSDEVSALTETVRRVEQFLEIK